MVGSPTGSSNQSEIGSAFPDRFLAKLQHDLPPDMARTQWAKSKAARKALELVAELQAYFAGCLSEATQADSSPSTPFTQRSWLRDEGRCGGGIRLESSRQDVFNAASINISQVQYEHHHEKKLNSATALSTIIHPTMPLAPSVHIHISWTEFVSGQGYWRLMGDLNPAIPNADDLEAFKQSMLETCDARLAQEALEQGDLYFFIPALNRHRGAVHFYLEGLQSPHPDQDLAFATLFGKSVTSAYANILGRHLKAAPVQASDDDVRRQLEYHTLYFLQVLTLDRGTTAGLMVHGENDIGILGSLPARVDKALLNTWLSKVEAIQKPLLEALIACLPEKPTSYQGISAWLVDEQVKIKLAQRIRSFYQRCPEALDKQARGNIVPKTGIHEEKA